MTIPGGRKFVVTMACQVITALLCVCDKIHEGIYSVVIVATVGAYITGNVVQKFTSKEGP